MATFLVLLRRSTGDAAPHLDAHRQWIADGRGDGTFLLVGSLRPDLGGALLVTAPTRAVVEGRVAADPFVEHGVVEPEILEFVPAVADPRLAFLLPDAR